MSAAAAERDARHHLVAPRSQVAQVVLMVIGNPT